MSCGAIRDKLQGAGMDDGMYRMGFAGGVAYINIYIENQHIKLL